MSKRTVHYEVRFRDDDTTLQQCPTLQLARHVAAPWSGVYIVKVTVEDVPLKAKRGAK